MSGVTGKGDDTLLKGAKAVGGARGDLEQRIGQLRGQLMNLGSQWQGQGRASFDTAMNSWEATAKKVVGALEGFEQNLLTSDKVYNANDESAASTFAKYNV